MADTPAPSLCRETLTESEACTNFAALRLWAAALAMPIAPCEAWNGDSVLRLIPGFAGRGDAPAPLLAGLLLAADLRPDDLVWVAGPAPDWLDLALGLTAGRAEAPEAASVWIGASVPERLPAALRRIILTEGRGQGAPAGVTLSLAADWVPSQR